MRRLRVGILSAKAERKVGGSKGGKIGPASIRLIFHSAVADTIVYGELKSVSESGRRRGAHRRPHVRAEEGARMEHPRRGQVSPSDPSWGLCGCMKRVQVSRCLQRGCSEAENLKYLPLSEPGPTVLSAKSYKMVLNAHLIAGHLNRAELLRESLAGIAHSPPLDPCQAVAPMSYRVCLR